MNAAEKRGTKLRYNNSGTAGYQSEKSCMAVFDSSYGKLFPEENAAREDDECRKRQIKRVGSEAQRLPTISDKCKYRQREGDYLIKEKDKPEWSRPIAKKSSQRFGTGIPVGYVVTYSSKKKETQTIGYQESQETCESELNGELNRKEES